MMARIEAKDPDEGISGKAMTSASAAKRTRRRSIRIVMRVPLYVSASNAPSTEEWEPVETLVLSLHGGLLRSRRGFPVGATLDIRMRNEQRSARCRVVWTGKGRGGNAVDFDVGFELLDPPGFWEVNFPADRWSENM